MAMLQKLITSRGYNQWPSWDIVFEWEDIFRESLNLTFSYEPAVNRYAKRIPLPLLTRLLHTSDPAFIFQMSADMRGGYDKRNIVPCIVDFFVDPKRLPFFYHFNRHHPLLLVSSAEAVQYLADRKCPLPVFHLPLSLPDPYAFDPSCLCGKAYDLLLAGRTSPVLLEYTERYAERHPDFVYVRRVVENGEFKGYTSRGECVGGLGTRAQYMALMRQSRVGLYATPGIDGGEERTRGFNPVTPRFLELVSGGCHILARYPKNPDTDYYELPAFGPSIDSFEQFEAAMDQALSHDVDAGFYASYLAKHYTSVRCETLKQILKSNNL